MPRESASIVNKRFGRLLVISVFDVVRKNYTRYLCQCDCGNKKVAWRFSLTRGSTRSCGCLAIESNKTHGKTYSKAYQKWAGMISRCKRPVGKNRWYKKVKVCDRWLHSFENFYADMGDPPKGLTLDRINSLGNYGPENCRWATWKQQASNRRTRSKKEL